MAADRQQQREAEQEKSGAHVKLEERGELNCRPLVVARQAITPPAQPVPAAGSIRGSSTRLRVGCSA